MRVYVKTEYFEYIEMKEGITIDEFVAKFGLPRKSAAVWLSNWAGRGYLTQDPPSTRTRLAGEVGRRAGGKYKVGPKWWGELVYGGNQARA